MTVMDSNTQAGFIIFTSIHLKVISEYIHLLRVFSIVGVFIKTTVISAYHKILPIEFEGIAIFIFLRVTNEILFFASRKRNLYVSAQILNSAQQNVDLSQEFISMLNTFYIFFLFSIEGLPITTNFWKNEVVT
jgi:hypothetical protein